MILGLLSIVVLYWVPVAMEDNERNHMIDVQEQFSKLKTTIDNQIDINLKNETRTTTFKLGSDTVPLFDRETPSQLSLRLIQEYFNLTFQDSGETIFENTSGSVHLRAYNRYYVIQDVIYENGAVIINQDKGSLVNVEPNFAVQVEGNNVTLTMTMVSLHGETEDTTSGIGTEEIITQLWYTDRWTYNNIDDPNRRATLTIVSFYSSAWRDYYDTILTEAGLVSGQDYNITSTSSGIDVTIDNVSQVEMTHAFFAARLGREAK